MGEWLTTYWPAILAGFIFGALFSAVREFSRRLVFSAVLFLITYKVFVNALAHAGAQWDHQLAGGAMLGIFVGCLVRPGVAGIVRKLTSVKHSGGASR
jgi:hypothetical protein